jgi:O-Antigen ligase
MLPVVVYVVGCFLAGLFLQVHAARRLSWTVAGTCALLCAVYLMSDQVPLPGFSIASLSSGETHDADGGAMRGIESPHAVPPGVSWFLRAGSTLSVAVARMRTLEESRVAAGLGVALFLLGAAAILVQPRFGLYLILFGALVGDSRLLPWYPFVKGFSSRESLFFVHDAFIVSPLELYIVLTVLSWSARRLRQGDLRLYTGRLFWPALAFAASLDLGLAVGLATGGDPRIALWEARAVFYLVPLMLLAGNLVERPSHLAKILSIASAALFIKGVSASLYYLLVLRGDLSGVESIAEHGAAIHLNTLFVASLAVWIYKGSLVKRILLPLAIPFVLLGYIAMQRRAAFVTLAIALVLVIILLYREQRRLFWTVAPAFFLLSGGYVAAGWNSQSTLAVPAQAIKSVYAAHLASDRDQSSNNYRVRENRNISFTIHQHPWAGIGFGRKFSTVVPLADISRLFEWWEYIPHNSILWIWMKAGIAGFFSLLCLIGFAVVGGAGSLERLACADLKAVVLTATLYIVMHFIYACVDMSWDAASAVFVGTMMGVVNCAESIETQQP